MTIASVRTCRPPTAPAAQPRSHGIGPDGTDDHDPPILTDDALRDEPTSHAEVVVTNPPFGKKSSITVVNEEGETDRQTLTYNRPDFWTTTSSKQLEFVQHVKSLLPGRGGQRALLRPQAPRQGALDQDGLGLRPSPSSLPLRYMYVKGIAIEELLDAKSPGQR